MVCRKRERKPQGFSDPWPKPAYDAFANMIDVHGPEKRTLLNTVSVWLAFAAALSTGFDGCFFAIETGGIGIVAGWIVGIVAGVVVFNIVMGWLAEDRYYRPYPRVPTPLDSPPKTFQSAPVAKPVRILVFRNATSPSGSSVPMSVLFAPISILTQSYPPTFQSHPFRV